MNKMFTLSRGGRAKEFGYEKSDLELKIYTGADFSTEYTICESDIEDILMHFKDKGWFILGNQVDNIKPNGLGDYFKTELEASPKFASHIAAYLMKQGKLDYRDDYDYLEFRVK